MLVEENRSHDQTELENRNTFLNEKREDENDSLVINCMSESDEHTSFS